MFAPLHDATFPAGEGFAGCRGSEAARGCQKTTQCVVFPPSVTEPQRDRQPLRAHRREYRNPNKNLPGYKKCPHSLILFVSFFAYFLFKESRTKKRKAILTTTLRDDFFFHGNKLSGSLYFHYSISGKICQQKIFWQKYRKSKFFVIIRKRQRKDKIL